MSFGLTSAKLAMRTPTRPIASLRRPRVFTGSVKTRVKKMQMRKVIDARMKRLRKTFV